LGALWAINGIKGSPPFGQGGGTSPGSRGGSGRGGSGEGLAPVDGISPTDDYGPGREPGSRNPAWDDFIEGLKPKKQ
jgi:hypothetical protein